MTSSHVIDASAFPFSRMIMRIGIPSRPLAFSAISRPCPPAPRRPELNIEAGPRISFEMQTSFSDVSPSWATSAFWHAKPATLSGPRRFTVHFLSCSDLGRFFCISFTSIRA